MKDAEVTEPLSGTILSRPDLERLIDTRELVIDPLLSREQIRATGIDVRLDTKFRLFRIATVGAIDVSEEMGEEELYEFHEARITLVESSNSKSNHLDMEPIIIHPHRFILAQTLEYVCSSKHYAIMMDGRSSLARKGIVVHATAGSVEPGFQGHLTLELGNVGELPVKIYPLARVANLHVVRVSKPVEYEGQFQHQVNIKPPKPDTDLLLLLGRR